MRPGIVAGAVFPDHELYGGPKYRTAQAACICYDPPPFRLSRVPVR